MKQFIREKEHVYFLADTRIDKDNIRELQRAISSCIQNPLFEMKWSSPDFNGAKRILEELECKSKFVDWNTGVRIEYFGLIAKKLEGKESLTKERYLCYDLEDMGGA